MADRVRVGVAGLGTVAQTAHLPLLARRADLFELAGVCDLSRARETVGARWGVPSGRQFASLAGMLGAVELDAVLVLTSGSHGGPVCEVLDAGVAGVLCEKPLAFSLAEADSVLRRVDGEPRVQVAYMKQYDPAFRALLDQLPDRDTIRSVDVEVLHPADAAQLAFANLPPRASDPHEEVLSALRATDDAALSTALGEASPAVRGLYSGVLLGSLVHDIALVRSLVGPPTSVDHVRVWPEGVTPGSVEVLGRLSGGAGLTMRWHYLADYPAYRETVTVHHDRGTLQVVFPSPYLMDAPSQLVVVDGAGGRPGTERRSVLRPAGEEFEEQLLGLHVMVTDGVPPLSGPTEGREDIRTAQRILRAWCERTGQTIGGEAAREH